MVLTSLKDLWYSNVLLEFFQIESAYHNEVKNL